MSVLCAGQCDTHEGLVGTNLFDANFVQWATDETCHNVPRCALPACLLAFAMHAHPRLGGRRHPGDDVLRLIFSHLS